MVVVLTLPYSLDPLESPPGRLLLLLMAVRVGVIDLSARAKTSWASPAHLPYLQASGSKYVIVALRNSIFPAVQSAIEAYNLPARTKAYGNPQDLAEDIEV